MKDVKVYYFPIKAKAEGLRLILAYGGQEFEDIRIPKEEWPKWKPKMKFGQMPVLEIEGQQFPQSVAAARYLGKQFQLAGDNDKEAYEIDCMVDYISDIFLRGSMVMYEPDPELKKKRHEMFSKDYYPGALAKLEEIAKANGGYLANGKLSWGDFILAGMYDHMKGMLQMPDFGELYPSIKAIHDHVYGEPKVKAWAESAPQTEV